MIPQPFAGRDHFGGDLGRGTDDQPPSMRRCRDEFRAVEPDADVTGAAALKNRDPASEIASVTSTS